VTINYLSQVAGLYTSDRTLKCEPARCCLVVALISSA